MSSSDHDSADRPPIPAETPADTPRRAARWWLPTGTFVAGVLVGVLGLGLLSSGAGLPDAPATDRSGTGPGLPSDIPLAATAQVNEACLRVINDAQAVYSALSGVGDLDPDVDLQRIDDLVRRLQPVQPRLEQDLPACQVSTDASAVPSAPAPSTPSPAAPVPSDSTVGPTSGPTR